MSVPKRKVVQKSQRPDHVSPLNSSHYSVSSLFHSQANLNTDLIFILFFCEKRPFCMPIHKCLIERDVVRAELKMYTTNASLRL